MKRALALLLGAALIIGATDAPKPSPSAIGYTPQDKDERGLWMEMEEYERELKASNFIIRDPALNAYVKGVLCRSVGPDKCGAARIYLMRTPYFNASMAPNGMMQVWSGLLLRMRDEAQLAAVLGHEFGHFERQHSLKLFKNIRSKTDAMAWLSFVPFGVGLLAQVGGIGSIAAFNRDMEREADADSVRFLDQGGYAPIAASAVWKQFREEQDATAAARKIKSRKDRNGGFFATHPTSGERMTELARLAAAVTQAKDDRGAARYRQALAAWWAPLIDDQVKLNDFGGTEFLLINLAKQGWTPELLYARAELHRARGKAGDFEAASGYYRQALAAGSTLPEARRGLGLALLRTGAAEEGRRSLKDYVRMKPDAPDKAMMAMLAGGA